MHGPPDPALSPALCPALSRRTGEGARSAGEGDVPRPEGEVVATCATADDGKPGAGPNRTRQRQLITAIATVLVSGRNRSLGLVLGAWGRFLPFLGLLAQLGFPDRPTHQMVTAGFAALGTIPSRNLRPSAVTASV